MKINIETSTSESKKPDEKEVANESKKPSSQRAARHRDEPNRSDSAAVAAAAVTSNSNEVHSRRRSDTPTSKSITHSGHNRKHSSGSSRPRANKSAKNDLYRTQEKCYGIRQPPIRPPCEDHFQWQNGKYVRDECGSGIVPLRFRYNSKGIWCRTPLSMYQATVGELGRQVLCRETRVPRDIRPGPPCNICENILRPCRGYYRRYPCVKPCEEEFAVVKNNVKVYRDPIRQYWDPCLTDEEKDRLNVNLYANHNTWLGRRVRRYEDTTPCW